MKVIDKFFLVIYLFDLLNLNSNLPKAVPIIARTLEGIYAINSVKFDPATARRCNDQGECSLAQGQGNWNIEALGHETFDFGDEMNHAHVQSNGQYHYHGMPELLIDFLGDNQGMTLAG